jgi:hypothetical protein
MSSYIRIGWDSQINEAISDLACISIFLQVFILLIFKNDFAADFILLSTKQKT